MSYPLSGVRVLDLSRLLPGAFATLMLAEMGADVIKIEDPKGGDPMRHLPPLVNGRGIYDLLLNRGKRSVALDLRLDESRDVLDRLVASSDVVIESFRPATARRLGVSGEVIRTRHPRVIHCAITGYGQTGPYADLPGHDLNYVAVSGMLAADRPDPAELPRMFIADVGGGAVSAVIAVLAALVRRGRDGQGGSIDVSMHEAMLYWVMLPGAKAFVDGAAVDDELPTFGKHACYNIYKAKDGRHIALGALESKFWIAFCAGIGRADLAARHLTGRADQAALISEVQGIFKTRTVDEWLAFFRGHDVCLTPVNQPADAIKDPHIAARGAVQSSPGFRSVRPPFLSDPAPLAPAPAIGQHTDEILRALND